MSTERLDICAFPSPPIDGVTYFCQKPEDHPGFHADDSGVFLWDNTDPDDGDQIWKRYRP